LHLQCSCGPSISGPRVSVFPDPPLPTGIRYTFLRLNCVCHAFPYGHLMDLLPSFQSPTDVSPFVLFLLSRPPHSPAFTFPRLIGGSRASAGTTGTRFPAGRALWLGGYCSSDWVSASCPLWLMHIPTSMCFSYPPPPFSYLRCLGLDWICCSLCDPGALSTSLPPPWCNEVSPYQPCPDLIVRTGLASWLPVSLVTPVLA